MKYEVPYKGVDTRHYTTNLIQTVRKIWRQAMTTNFGQAYQKDKQQLELKYMWIVEIESYAVLLTRKLITMLTAQLGGS